jgi:hypothetical protein
VVLLAHRNCIPGSKFGDEPFSPGIFRAFIPQRIEYIITGEEDTTELDNLEKRGFSLIDVIPVGRWSSDKDSDEEGIA